mgnify:CR=1 FL=1
MNKKKDLLDILKNLTIVLSVSGTITLAWDANTEPDLSGYKIYYGLESRNYTNTIDVSQKDFGPDCTPYDPFKTECCEVTLEGFTKGKTYYFAATAYDEEDNESAYSEELTHTFDGTHKTIQMPGGYKKK